VVTAVACAAPVAQSPTSAERQCVANLAGDIHPGHPVVEGSAQAPVRVVVFHDLHNDFSQAALLMVAQEVARYSKASVRLSVRQLPQARSGPPTQLALQALVAACGSTAAYFDVATRRQPATSIDAKVVTECESQQQLRSDMNSARAL